MTGEAIETPSGKGAADENFPVGSFLLPRRLRPHVAVFYQYARAIDDIADNPDLEPQDKIRRLDAFEAVLTRRDPEQNGPRTARRMRDSLDACGITARHCLDLISAFKQDAVKKRYADWDELIDYCNRSAAPVGRYLLDLHEESPDHYPYSDALCNALQVINHLQDCQDDYRNLDRVYLPTDWMTAAGVEVGALDANAASPGLRRVLDLTLGATEELMRAARLLPGKLTSRRLAWESAAIVAIADKLCDKLSGEDPLSSRVVLTRPQFMLCAARGVSGTVFSRAKR